MKSRLAAILLAFVALVASALPREGGLCWFNYRVDDTQLAVFNIFRDSVGRNWLGTTSGLFLFDGYQSYAAELDGATFRAQVYAMVETGGKIFVGANDGLFLLNPQRNTLEHVEGNFPREIRAMVLIGDELWIGSLSGLYHYSLSQRRLRGPEQAIPRRAVYSLLEASDGTVYIGTYDGLFTYSPLTGAYSRRELSRDYARGGNVFVNAIAEEHSSGRIYLGTEGALFVLDPVTGALSVVPDCDGNSVKALAFSRANLVVGTDNGLILLPLHGSPMVFRHDSRSAVSLASNVVWSVFADPLGNLWCGTEAGVSIIDYTSPVRVYSLADLTGMSEGQQVYNMLRDSRQNLWIGGSNGIVRLPEHGAARWFTPGKKDENLSHNRVRGIMESSDGKVWVATDGGINIYDEGRGVFVNHRITDRDRRLNANWAYGVLEDTADSTLWVAGYLGGIFKEKLSRFRAEGDIHRADTVFSALRRGMPNDLIGSIVQDGERNKWVLHFRDSALTRIDGRSGALARIDIRSVTGQEPTTLCVDPTGALWCGFYGGVARIEPSGKVSDKIIRFPFGGADETVRAMAAVGREIWVATSSAVWAVNPATMKARVLPLPSKAYTAIYYDSRAREAILGATDEIVVAQPQRLLDEPVDEEIVMLRVREGDHKMNIPLKADGKVPSIKLPGNNRDIEIDPVAAYFSPGEYLRFCYSIDGGDSWQLLPDGDNRIRLTSLPPGSHHIEVAVAGAPASSRSIEIEVPGPWYQSRLAVALYVLCFFLIITMIVKEGRRRQKRHLEEMERTNVLATVENRLFFLANISHELKTPLSMIIGPLSKVRTGETPEEASHDIDTAYENAIRLNSLIHQTVEINRLELGSEKMLIISRIDVVEFCRDIFDSYRRGVAERQFVFTSSAPHIYASTDAVKLESLVSNLLSNAVKYTAAGSTIALSVSESASDFEISVSDDGVGIPEAEQSLVFQRLYRSPRTAGSHEGTGIGLYLVRQYARLLGGSVTVESRVDEGSTFRLRLPLGEPADAAGASESPEAKAADKADSRPRVLIVDDNRSIATFVQSILAKDYNCAIADNGKAGLAVAANFRPDLVIADEMMPLMSGLEMSRRLKANPALAHVPILLLTAKNTPGIHGESISSGVDAFMPKPFEVPTLRAKVAQLLEAGEKMRRNLRLERLTDTAVPEPVESASEKQLAAVTNVIENNLANPDLNVDFVCKTLDIPSKNLYRLLKKYVGVSPVDYIRQMRLRKAAMLLEQKKFSVSEVMYMVGFSSSSYFSKCFSAMFGCSPGQYPPRQ